MGSTTRRVAVVAALATAILGGMSSAEAATRSATGPTAAPGTGNRVTAKARAGGVYAVQGNADGTWGPATPLPGPDGSPLAAGSVSATTMPDGSVQVVATDPACGLCYQNRLVDGTWTGWQTLNAPDGSAVFAANEVAIAGLTDGSSVVLATDQNHVLYHRIQDPDGIWSDWRAIPGEGRDAPTIQVTSPTVVGRPDGSYLMAALEGGRLLLEQPGTLDGGLTWWRVVPGLSPDLPFEGDAVSVTQLADGSSHYLATYRRRTSTLPPGALFQSTGDFRQFAMVPGRDGAAAFIGAAVSMTPLADGSTQFLATDRTTHYVYRNVRRPDGTLGGWQPVPGPGGDGTNVPVNAVSGTGMPDGTTQLIEAT
ncbi:hypothetical protein [Amycolatopsis samaneae]|uniref:Uncharacterized protein n=1 Tax=Amycolatopsis samaneae TaxID=664691 RepID=A0ABW5GRR3_9PSEU